MLWSSIKFYKLLSIKIDNKKKEPKRFKHHNSLSDVLLLFFRKSSLVCACSNKKIYIYKTKIKSVSTNVNHYHLHQSHNQLNQSVVELFDHNFAWYQSDKSVLAFDWRVIVVVAVVVVDKLVEWVG